MNRQAQFLAQATQILIRLDTYLLNETMSRRVYRNINQIIKTN